MDQADVFTGIQNKIDEDSVLLLGWTSQVGQDHVNLKNVDAQR